MERDKRYYRYGYYVYNQSGVLNFYSNSGERIFYVPKKGKGVFSADEGEFCGVIAEVEGQFSLFLTEPGYKKLIFSNQ